MSKYQPKVGDSVVLKSDLAQKAKADAHNAEDAKLPKGERRGAIGFNLRSYDVVAVENGSVRLARGPAQARQELSADEDAVCPVPAEIVAPAAD